MRTQRMKAAAIRRAAILEMAENGPLPMQKVLARKFRVSEGSITADVRALRKDGHELLFSEQRKPRKIVISPDKIEAIKADYVSGFTLNQLTTKYRLGLRRLSDMTQPWQRAPDAEAERISRAFVRTKSDRFDSTTHSDHPKRAHDFQVKYRAAAAKYVAEYRARAAA